MRRAVDSPASIFVDLYGPARSGPAAYTPGSKRMAAKLLTLCASLHECPIVRCRRGSPMEATAKYLVVGVTSCLFAKDRGR